MWTRTAPGTADAPKFLPAFDTLTIRNFDRSLLHVAIDRLLAVGMLELDVVAA